MGSADSARCCWYEIRARSLAAVRSACCSLKRFSSASSWQPLLQLSGRLEVLGNDQVLAAGRQNQERKKVSTRSHWLNGQRKEVMTTNVLPAGPAWYVQGPVALPLDIRHDVLCDQSQH